MRNNLLFIAMFFLSMGMYAQSWTQQNTNFPGTSIGVDEIAIVDSNIVWVKGFNGSGVGPKIKAFSKTQDGGTTWTPGTFTGFGTAVMPYVIGATGYDTAFCVAMDTTAGAASFWKSFDGGANWTKVTGVLNSASSFADGVKFWSPSQGFCYGDPVSSLFEIYTTSDGGATWTAATTSVAPVPAAEYGYNGVDCAAIVPGGIGFIMTDHGRILRTTDYGATWAVTPTAPFVGTAQYGSIKVFASSANYIICATYVTATTTWTWKYTTDGGTTWQTFAPTGAFYDWGMCYAPGSVNTFISTSPSTTTTMGVSHSEDGGLSWTDYLDGMYLQPLGSNIQCLAVNFYNEEIGWVGNYDALQTINSILKYRYVAPNGVNLYQLVNGNDLNIFPNPVKNLVNFAINGSNNDDINISVFDITGKKIFNTMLNINGISSTSFDFSGFSKGVYIVNVSSGKDNYNKKLVLQ